MEVHPLDFEKPILELQRRLQDLKNHSDEHALDFENEVESMENKSARPGAKSTTTSPHGSGFRLHGTCSGLSRSITSGVVSRSSSSCTATARSGTIARCRAGWQKLVQLAA
jgi:hypothetical protein